MERIDEEESRLDSSSLIISSMRATISSVKIPSRPIHCLKAHEIEGHTVTINNQGDLLATGAGNQIKLWELNNNGSSLTELSKYSKLQKSLTTLSFSHQSDMLLVFSQDHQGRILRCPKLQDSVYMKGHTDIISDACFNHDGKQVVSGSRDCTVQVWQSSNGARVHKVREDLGLTYIVCM